MLVRWPKTRSWRPFESRCRIPRSLCQILESRDEIRRFSSEILESRARIPRYLRKCLKMSKELGRCPKCLEDEQRSHWSSPENLRENSKVLGRSEGIRPRPVDLFPVFPWSLEFPEWEYSRVACACGFRLSIIQGESTGLVVRFPCLSDHGACRTVM